jgi:hypothetical protein
MGFYTSGAGLGESAGEGDRSCTMLTRVKEGQL